MSTRKPTHDFHAVITPCGVVRSGHRTFKGAELAYIASPNGVLLVKADRLYEKGERLAAPGGTKNGGVK